ncbi:MAG: flagellar hook capping FlgD N-terminal domain-containing protein [Pyrinomonadaceae bacterium]
METNPISNFSATTTSGSTGSSQTAAGSERDLFMSLLVAQLKNQDPLSPQDGTAFVAQLAQFNSLDQLIGIRQTLERLSAISESPINIATSANIAEDSQ